MILGLETSCDETAAALVTEDGRIGANVVSSQAELHARFGGVVPEVASRHHLENVVPVLRTALEEAGAGLGDVDRVAVTRGPGLIGALLFDVAWPPGVDSWLLGLVSAVLAVVVAFAGTFIVNLSAFWVIEVRGIRLVWMITSGFLCGLYVPIPWFPDWLRTIAQWTPFPAMLQNPVDILSGRVDGGAIWMTLAGQVAWGALLVVAGQVVLNRGRRRVEVQGG